MEEIEEKGWSKGHEVRSAEGLAKGRAEGYQGSIRFMQNAGKSLQQIAEFMNLPLDKVEAMAKGV